MVRRTLREPLCHYCCGEGVQGPFEVMIPRTAATARLRKMSASIAIFSMSFLRKPGVNVGLTGAKAEFAVDGRILG